MALVEKTFSEALTFSRASTATYFDGAGVLQTAAADTARFDHDPVTKEPLGVLIEESRTNPLTYSEAFDNAAWAKTDASVTVNAVVAPDGATTADKLIEGIGTASKHVSQSYPATDNTVYTLSAFVKAAERSWVKITIQRKDGTSPGAYFNVSTGAKGTLMPGARASSINDVGSGWYRVDVAVDVLTGATASPNAYLQVAQADGDDSYIGDGASGVYIWGAQLEEGAFPTSYIPTTTAAVTRAGDKLSRTFGAEHNPREWTVYCEFQVPAIKLQTILGDTSRLDFQPIRMVSSGRFDIDMRDAGSTFLAYPNVTAETNTVTKCAVSIKASEVVLSVGGLSVTHTGDFNLNSLFSGITLGRRGNANNQEADVRFLAVRYYPHVMTATELQELTA